ncbi:Glycerol-3-phosphate 2-O-acyltransferase 4 [Platanthera zijinensis]|uniref:Glycerol-3-phosphate 2-O-acyltransferase 4 n=1 Tax=Platanthera zijinensis TaxID=2320716 RepID=A0AAP0FU29_9ASPA
MIYAAATGIPISDIKLVARALLLRFYVADVLADSYRIFRACQRRRVVVSEPNSDGGAICEGVFWRG